MTALFDDDGVIDMAAQAYRIAERNGHSHHSAIRAALTAALTPEPTPLEAAAEVFADVSENADRKVALQAAIDAYHEAGGAAKRRITENEFWDFMTAATKPNGSLEKEPALKALAAIGIEVMP